MSLIDEVKSEGSEGQQSFDRWQKSYVSLRNLIEINALTIQLSIFVFVS